MERNYRCWYHYSTSESVNHGSGAECSSHSSQNYSILDYFLKRQPVPRIYVNPTVFGPKLSTTIPYISTNPPAPPY